MNATRALSVASAHVPSVEDQLIEVEQTLAMFLLLSRALEQVEDLSLDQVDQNAAWAKIGEVAQNGLASLRAASRALPVTATQADAPTVTGGSR